MLLTKSRRIHECPLTGVDCYLWSGVAGSGDCSTWVRCVQANCSAKGANLTFAKPLNLGVQMEAGGPPRCWLVGAQCAFTRS